MRAKVYFFLGTTAELIKLFPVTNAFRKNQIDFSIIHTGQNQINDKKLRFAGKLFPQETDITLSYSRKISSPFELIKWFLTTLIRGLIVLRPVLTGSNSILIIHGDTVSTVMGAFIGWIYGIKIFHIEAGLRSFDYFHPFPEEIDRKITSWFVHTHFCSNRWAVDNLKSASGLKINTRLNTLADATKVALLQKPTSKIKKIKKQMPYFIAVIHRQENVYQKVLFTKFIQKILIAANTTTCYFILHGITRDALVRYGLLNKIKQHPRITCFDRLHYFDMVHLIKNASFFVTDGGSNQEEAYYLGVPTLILRKKTERIEGLGKNVVLYKGKISTIDAFFNNYASYKRHPIQFKTSPSMIISKNVLKYLNSSS